MVSKEKGGRRRYAEMVDPKYSGITYEAEMKLEIHAALEVLEMHAYVDSDGSVNKEKNARSKLKCSCVVVKGGVHAGLHNV